MSFDIAAAGGYGSGALGDVTDPVTQINSYAKITARTTSTITIDRTNASIGLVDFVAGSEVLLHISGIKPNGNPTALGRYKIVKINSVNGDQLTLSDEGLYINVDDYFYQAITIPHFKTLTLTGAIAPLAFDESKGIGGILIFKAIQFVCSGSINLIDKGLVTDSYRPLLAQEEDGIQDWDIYSAFENYETCNHFALNKGDGAAFIIAKQVDFNAAARIGNPNVSGVARCRGTRYSLGAPEGITNVGGSTILIAANEMNNFTPDIIAKYRNSSLTQGKGLCRAYIATESNLPCDEGLYSYDLINTPERLTKETLINGFGSGLHGNARSPLLQQNNYAKVTAISSDGKTFTVQNLTTDGYAQFETQALVMVHAATKKTTQVRHSGRFFVAKIVGIKKTSPTYQITLDHSFSDINLGALSLDNYNFQIITIPQYSDFTLNDTNDKTPKYENSTGGIFAIAVNGTCNISGGKILVEDKGGAVAYGSTGLDYISNANMKNRLPIGEGHGSVFILANELIMDDSTRLGASYSGANLAPKIYSINSDTRDRAGGWRGATAASQTVVLKSCGSGFAGGVQDGHNGGFGSNSSDGDSQGAHIFIVAQTISGLNMAALSTGGQRGSIKSKYGVTGFRQTETSGAGYGGAGGRLKYKDTFDRTITAHGHGGGVHGGGSGVEGGIAQGGYSPWISGGGASGFCFVYANQVVNQSTENLIFD